MQRPVIKKVDAQASLDEIAETLDRDGVICLTNILSSQQISGLREELDPEFDSSGFCEGPFFGGRTKRLHSLVVKSAICRDMIVNPVVLSIMNHILGKQCDKIQLNLTQGVQIWPGQAAQIMHRDDSMFPMNIMPMPYELMADVMWAYSDFTEENGATLVVPGSHKWDDRKRVPKEEEMVQATMKAGDILIYIGSALHCGGANRSTQPRTGLIISYCLGWLRQFENQYLVAPPATAKHYSKQLQDLLGYCIHRPNLGMYEGNEPSVLFDDDQLANLVTRDRLTDAQYDIIKQANSNDPADVDHLLLKAN